MNEIVCVDGGSLVLRPIERTDVDRLARMFTRLSPESIYFRFFAPIRELPRSTLLSMADVDHARRDAIVALDGDEIIAVARYAGLQHPGRPEASEAEIAVTVEDSHQHRGVGRLLATRLAVLARDRGYQAFVASILPDNRAALALMRELVPDATVRFTSGAYEAHLGLCSSRPGRSVHSAREVVTGPVATRDPGEGPSAGAPDAGASARSRGRV